MAEQPIYDIVVIGGGINGAGIARDAAGRGLNVVLVEQNDLAQATSSASSKLIHGGLRYLERYDFGLVRKALIERETLLRIAPHIIWPLSFVLPHDEHLRPKWLIRCGLFLYDFLGRLRFPPRRSHFHKSYAVNLRSSPLGNGLNSKYEQGFVYADGWVQDSRLVVLNAMDARNHGAHIMPRTRCLSAVRNGGFWRVMLEDKATQKTQIITTRVLVNAGGPWALDVAEHAEPKQPLPGLQLIRGSHIVVNKLFDHDHAYIIQNKDGRIVFALPYEEKFTLIGTTDMPHDSGLGYVKPSMEEIVYLCEVVNAAFNKQITPGDVVWSYAGVRPLADDSNAADSTSAAKLSRDYRFVYDAPASEAPALHVFGGKLTTYRKLAEEAVDKLVHFFPHAAHAWTAYHPLPGGDIPKADFNHFVRDQQQRYPWLPRELLYRYARNYGTKIQDIIGKARSLPGLGQHFGDGVYEAEARYLMRYEWAQTSEDILWRRSKLGLHISDATKLALDKFLDAAHHEKKGKRK